MPLREYECFECGFRSERLEFTPTTPDDAPMCPRDGNRMGKLVSVSNIAFRGTGWTERGPSK